MTTVISKATTAEKRRRTGQRSGVAAARPGFVWALPAVLFFTLFAIIPLILVFVLSFTQWDGLSDPTFVGLDKWKELADDPVMLQGLWLSVLLTVLSVAVQTPTSIVLGVWAAGPQRNRAVLSAIYFVPLLLSVAAIALLWHTFLDPNFGVPAYATWLFGDGNLFGHQSTAIAVLVFVGAWQYTPFHALIYQGAARAIPRTLYEAAEIDGAGRIRTFFKITLPLLRTSMITSVIIQVVGGMTVFDSVLILTKGGPGTDTKITAYYMYEKAFKSYDYGGSAVIATLLVVMATIISLVMVKLSGYDKMRSTQEGV